MIIIILVALAISMLVLRWLLTTDAAVLAVAFKRSAIILVVTVLIFLIATGRLNFIVPLMIALLPMVVPALRKFISSNISGQGPFARSSGRMTTTEAYEVLGLNSGASKEDIIAAHKRLVKKIHPDTGGSTYLTQKLNEARDLLLGR